MSNQLPSNMEALPAAAESEQVMLAQQVDQARIRLLTELLQSRAASGFVASRLLGALGNAADSSDIILAKNCDQYRSWLQAFVDAFSAQTGASRIECQLADNACCPVTNDEEVVQGHSFVQLCDWRCLQFDVPADALRVMSRLHFLPVFLINTAESLLKNPLLSAEHGEAFCGALRQHCSELKNRRQRMISANTGLVAFVAHKYKTACLSFDDLMQEGLVGLIKAVDRFDPERGICFSTYAIYWIRQAISRLIVKQDKIVPLPVAVAEKSSVVFEAMRQCYLQNERWPTMAELKACCDLSEQELKLISGYYQATYTLETAGDDDDGLDAMEKMQQWQFALPLEQLIDRDLATYVDMAVASLPEKQATILTMRFGLKNHTEMTLQAVADQLQVTRERVRQIQNEALKKLKQQFGFDLMLFLEPNDS